VLRAIRVEQGSAGSVSTIKRIGANLISLINLIATAFASKPPLIYWPSAEYRRPKSSWFKDDQADLQSYREAIVNDMK